MTEQFNDAAGYDRVPEEAIFPAADLAQGAAEVASDQVASEVLPEGDWPVLLTRREVAGLLNCSMETVRKAIIRGQLSAIRTPGGEWRFNATEIDEIRKDLGY